MNSGSGSQTDNGRSAIQLINTCFGGDGVVSDKSIVLSSREFSRYEQTADADSSCFTIFKQNRKIRCNAKQIGYTWQFFQPSSRMNISSIFKGQPAADLIANAGSMTPHQGFAYRSGRRVETDHSDLCSDFVTTVGMH